MNQYEKYKLVSKERIIVNWTNDGSKIENILIPLKAVEAERISQIQGRMKAIGSIQSSPGNWLGATSIASPNKPIRLTGSNRNVEQAEALLKEIGLDLDLQNPRKEINEKNYTNN